MSAPRRARRAIDGVILLDKPVGISSQQAVSRVRHLFGAAKAGHTGTLDPAAEGLLPVCLGEATKFSHFLLDADKTYVAKLRLGVVTDTGDADGVVLANQPPVNNRDTIQRVLEEFHGERMQMPPMYSALKHQGVPLYEYARRGVTIERKPRPVRIDAIDMLALEADVLTLRVRCSKGTYIRVLAADIGEALGCGASLTALQRTQTGMLDLAHAAARTLNALTAMPMAEREALLLPSDTLVAGLPALEVDAAQAARLLSGQKLGLKHAQIMGFARIYGPKRRFLGLVEVEAGGRTIPRRMLVHAVAAEQEMLEKTPI